jgi:hypothetical protein
VIFVPGLFQPESSKVSDELDSKGTNGSRFHIHDLIKIEPDPMTKSFGVRLAGSKGRCTRGKPEIAASL